MYKSEKINLLATKTKNVKNWCNIVLFGILMVIALFLLYMFIPKSNTSTKISAKNPLHILSKVTNKNEYLQKCAPQVVCESNAKYRSTNGSCNNLNTPTWGASSTPFLRLLDASYSDGYYKLRVQANGTSLPLVRELNVKLFFNREVYHQDENNVLLMPFAQTLAHDITSMSVDTLMTEDGDVLSCCASESIKKTYAQCDTNTYIPPDDPVYGKLGITCLDTFRFVTSKNYSCNLYPTTFFNTKTSFIDVSELYGSTDTVALQVRSMEDGMLKFSRNSNGQMFCQFTSIAKALRIVPSLKFQYYTGDPDVNQNLGITAMETLLLRFHNYIASRLISINPFWIDEIIFQETRRIVIGVVQRITYEEFLPIIIGKNYQELYGINEENIYDPTIDSSLSQEFSSAAFRALHTIIPVQFRFMNNDYKIKTIINITDWMSNPELLPEDNHFSELFNGMLETAGRVPQHSYNFFVSNYLFGTPHNNSDPGFDLMSVDIMAGRDVGLQPYNQYRRLCGLPMAKDFDDLMDLMQFKDIDTLKKLYYSVDDIDLMVGLLLERISDDAIIGPTARCLFADSLYRLKAGDRYFYDVKGQPGSFTPDQLKVIRETSFSHLICATSNVGHVQKDIFKLVDHNFFSTMKLKCNNGFDIDLSPWKQHNNHAEL